MARLIGRLSWTLPLPDAAQAQRCGIAHWLVPVRIDAGGELELAVPPEELLAQHPSCGFSLEWQLPYRLSPRQELEALQRIRPWLEHRGQLTIGGRAVLWIREPEQLSHPMFAARRLRTGLRDQVLLLAAGPPDLEAFEASYERIERLPVQRLRGGGRNYESFLARAHYSLVPEQRLLLPAVSACPGDDLLHVSPAHYREWLEQSRAWMDLSRSDASERLVLVDDWRSHAACLAQDSAVTSTPASTVQPAPITPAIEQGWGAVDGSRPALLVHGFHLNLLASLLEPLASSEPRNWPLYLSTPPEQLEAAEVLLRAQGWPQVRLVGTQNRGRDMAPFLLELLPRALAAGHPWLIKLHTKRSPDKPGGQAWGRRLWHALTGEAGLRQLQQLWEQDPELQLVAPAGALLPCTVCLGGNAEALALLLQASGLEPHWWLRQRFAAGSMWAARSSALQPLLALGQELGPMAFKAEAGQTDGTLAHAFERLLPALLLRQGGRAIELPADPGAVPQPFGHLWALPEA